MTLTIISLIIALFFAINIGASGSAASMSAAYGGGAIKKRWVALVLVSISVFLGAYFGSGEVVKTIGNGIIPSEILDINITIIILSSACLTLFFANIMGIPLSTSEVTVGSVVGVGIAYHSLFADKLLIIISTWLVLPFLAYIVALLLGKFSKGLEKKLTDFPRQHIITKTLVILLILTGCYEAFAAGMNNVANAIGPLVGAGIIEMNTAILWGGLFLGLGALLLGGRVLETNSKKITKLSLLQGSIVSFTSGSLVMIASLFGIPVPLTQATTMAIFGIGSSKDGLSLFKSNIVKKIIKIWVVSPISSMVVSYLLVQTIIENNLYATVVVIGTFIMSIGYMSFLKPKKGENYYFNKNDH